MVPGEDASPKFPDTSNVAAKSRAQLVVKTLCSVAKKVPPVLLNNRIELGVAYARERIFKQVRFPDNIF